MKLKMYQTAVQKAKIYCEVLFSFSECSVCLQFRPSFTLHHFDSTQCYIFHYFNYEISTSVTIYQGSLFSIIRVSSHTESVVKLTDSYAVFVKISAVLCTRSRPILNVPDQ